MRIKFLSIILSFMIISCKDNNTINKKVITNKDDTINEYSKINVTGHTFFKITETDSGRVLYKPCGAIIEKYVIYNDSIFHNLGQEHYMLNISSSERMENDIIYKMIYKNNKEIPESRDRNIKFISLDKNQKFWKINDEVFIDSIFSNTLPLKKELPCDEDCYDCEESTKKINDLEKNDIIVTGTWKLNCENGNTSMQVDNNNASLEVMFNQIYIDMVEIQRNNLEKGIAYKLKEKPEDLGNYAVKMDWKSFINDKPIAYVKVIDDQTLYFYWYGFYNNKTKKREFTECKFQQDSNEKYQDHHIVLKKCEFGN